jgi:hypothetical protein
MRAVVCKEFGPPEKLVIEEVEDPAPGPGQVLIDVKAAAVTFPDCLLIEDKYQFKAAPPFIPGGEVGGIIAALGEGVDGFEIGDRVVGNLGMVGGFAEQAVAAAAGTRVLPDGAGLGISEGDQPNCGQFELAWIGDQDGNHIVFLIRRHEGALEARVEEVADDEADALARRHREQELHRSPDIGRFARTARAPPGG